MVLNKQDQPTKVLIISQHFPPEKSANASRIYEMSYNLSKFGVEATVFSPHPTFPTKIFKKTWKISQTSKINGVKVLNLWCWQPGAKDPRFLSRMLYYLTFPLHASLWALISSKDYDIIITSNPPVFTAIPGLLSKWLLNKKWIIDVRDSWVDASISLGFLTKGSIFEKMSRKFEEICYKNANLVGTTTKVLAQCLSNIYDIKKTKVTSIPNGADTELFYPRNVPKKNQIIFLGSMGHAQDLEKYILAMKKVSKKHDVKLLILGNGEKKEELEKMVESKGLSEVVVFKDLIPRKKVPKVLSESLIGIVPLKRLKTLNYAIPLKVYEYMACELPFIASGMGEIVSLAEESKGGLITEDSSTEIAKGIVDLLNNPQKMEKMGKNGRKFVEKYYDRKDIDFKLKRRIENI